MTGQRGAGKHGQRPEIIGKFGYDTKAAMHTLRLLYEGIELMKDRWVTLPRPSPERDLLLAVRRGEWSEDRVIEHAKRLLRTLEDVCEASALPATIDSAAISELVSGIHVDHWAKLRRIGASS